MDSQVERAFNRVAKWRSVFAGWQLGTRIKGDPESDAVRDHREATILLRVETTAILGLLLKKGLIGREELGAAIIEEANELSKMYEQKFPGMKATDDGIQMDHRAAETMRYWRP